MKEEKFIDRTILKLRRQYSKDELISAMSKQMSEKDIKIGILKSTSDELNHEIQLLKYSIDSDKSLRKEIKAGELYMNQKAQIKALRESNRQLKVLKDNYLSRLLNSKNN